MPKLPNTSVEWLAGIWLAVFTTNEVRGTLPDTTSQFSYWEVLNEPEYEHQISIAQYTKLFDKISATVRRVAPQMKFVGMSLAEPSKSPEAFEYFLNPGHHTAGKRVDAISYHFYAVAEPAESVEAQAYSFFAQADGFLNSVRYIEAIRKRLSPTTETHINEVGCLAASDVVPGPDHMELEPSAGYYRLCAAVFAYLYVDLAKQGIDVVGASQLLGYPSQYPSVSLLDWKTGAPDPRCTSLELLHRWLGVGDRPAKTVVVEGSGVFAAGYLDPSGRRKVLIMNKRDSKTTVDLEPSGPWVVERAEPAVAERIAGGGGIDLGPFEVVIAHDDGWKR